MAPENQTAISSMPGIAVVDTCGMVVSWDAGAERLTGRTFGEMRGRAFPFCPGCAEHSTGHPLMSSPCSHEDGIHLHIDRPDGAGQELLAFVSPIAGTPLYTVILMPAGATGAPAEAPPPEVAAARQEAKVAIESRAKLEAALASMADAVVFTDAAGRLIDFNDAFAVFNRFRSKDECAQTLAEYPDILDVFFANGEPAPLEQWAIPRALRGESATNEEYIARRKDTGETWVGSFSFGPIRDSGGAVVGSVMTARDITRRKKYEEALRVSEEKFVKAFASHPAAVVLTRLEDGLFLDVNDTWIETMGYTREETVGFSDKDLPIWLNPEAREPFVDELRRNGSVRNREQTFRRKSGEPIVALLSAEVLTVGGEKLILSTFLDITERKRTEEALRESEERFRALADNISQLAWMIDADGRSAWFNQRWHDYTGLTPEDAPGYDRRLLYHPDHAARVLERWEHCRVSGEPWEDTVPIRGRDGLYRWFLSRAVPIRDGSGQVVRWVGTNTDISDRLKMEEELRHNDEQLRIATFAAEVGVWSWTPGTDKIIVSANWRALFGISPDAQLTFESWRDAVHPDDRERAVAELLAATENHTDFDTEYRVVLPGGPVRWMADRGRASYDADGRPTGMAGVNIDITRRKLAEEALRETSQRLKYHVENSPLAVVEFDADFRIARWSSEAERVFGWTEAEALGMSMWEIPWIHPGDMDKVEAIAQAMIYGEQPRNAMANRNVRKDGRTIWCVWYNSAMLDAEGRLVSILSLVLDVTDRVNAEEALAAADRAKDDFLAMLAHELRNPLSAISNAASLIEMRADGRDDLSKPLDILNRQIKHTARLVDDLLDVSRISRGKLELRRELLDLAEVTRRAVDTIRPQMDVCRHRFTVSVPSSALWMEGDSARLEQILGNLLNNAAKYTDPGGQIELTVSVCSEEALIRVRDNGQGIAPEMLPGVFDLFAQEDRSLARSKGGLGIGLTLVKRLVEMHGGSVEAISEGPRRGSEFRVRLPLLETSGTARPAAEVSDGPSVPRRILLVEDNEDAAGALAEILTLWGHEATVVHDGPAALEAAAQRVPDVVLLDIGLPVMDGYEVARALRREQTTSGVHLVALTGYGQDSDQERARQAGFDRHLTKPVDIASLKAILADAG